MEGLMQNLIKFIAICLGVFAANIQISAQSIAVYRETKATNQIKYSVFVFVDTKVEGTLAPLPVSLVRIEGVNRTIVTQTTVASDKLSEIPKGVTFSIDLSEPLLANTQYKLAITPGGLRLADIDVTRGLTSEFLSEPGHQCPGAIALRLRGIPGDDAPKDPKFWEPIFDYILRAGRKPSDFATVGISNSDKAQPLALRSLSTPTISTQKAADSGRMIICLAPATSLPEIPFSIKLEFKNNPPSALSERMTGKGLSSAGSPSFKDASADPGSPGDRALERNLDLGVSFTSSVDAVPKEQQDEKGEPKFKRTNRGVLDIRFAPWLNLKTTTLPDPNQRWFTFWTPIYLDANVATGKIEKETISLNRIILGSEVEFRFIDFRKRGNQSGEVVTDTSRVNDFFRIILRGNHAADRDFKQLEYTGTFEFQPVLAAFYKPLDANFRVVANAITGQPEFKQGHFGMELFPKVGFSLGRTYARRNPAEAIEASDTVKRLFAGFDLKLNLTQHIGLDLTDTIFYRGELVSNRSKNYFKGELNLLLGRPFPQSTHGFFLSYEHGNLPPFSKLDVNAVKIGYRIRSDSWFGRVR